MNILALGSSSKYIMKVSSVEVVLIKYLLLALPLYHILTYHLCCGTMWLLTAPTKRSAFQIANSLGAVFFSYDKKPHFFCGVLASEHMPFLTIFLFFGGVV